MPQINIDLLQPMPFMSLPDAVSTRVRAATWKIHWPEISRGSCACVGVAIHPNSPDSPLDHLLYWELAQLSPAQLGMPVHSESYYTIYLLYLNNH